MKNFFFLFCIIFNSICFGQSDLFTKSLMSEGSKNFSPYHNKKNALSARAIISGYGSALASGNFYRGKPLPTLLFSGYSREIDSSMQDSLNIIYTMMSENSTMILQVVGLFQHEKNFSPFQKRAMAVRDHLIEMGIANDRLKTTVKQYTELKDSTITRDKANVIFEILSFDYFPSRP